MVNLGPLYKLLQVHRRFYFLHSLRFNHSVKMKTVFFVALFTFLAIQLSQSAPAPEDVKTAVAPVEVTATKSNAAPDVVSVADVAASTVKAEAVTEAKKS